MHDLLHHRKQPIPFVCFLLLLRLVGLVMMRLRLLLALALTKACSREGTQVIHRPLTMGTFEFVTMAALRAAQLTRGCRPKVDGIHTTAIYAQREVAEGKIVRATAEEAALPYVAPPLDAEPAV